MSPATGPGTTIGRITELETHTAAIFAQLAHLTQRLDAALKLTDAISHRLCALEDAQDPPRRDPASTTAASTNLATPPRTRQIDGLPPRALWWVCGMWR